MLSSQETPYRVVGKNGAFYLYSGITSQIYPLTKEAIQTLDSIAYDSKKLWKYESSCSRALPIVTHQLSREAVRDQVHKSLKTEVHQVTLCITERCNLGCSYCINSDNCAGTRSYSDKTMSWDVARAAIDYLLDHCSDSPVGPAVSFYGGEPLLEFDLIRRCVEYAKRFSDRIYFTITTNGTLMEKRVRRYLIDQNIGVCVSLDGPASIHDRYRRTALGRPTFQRIMSSLALIRREAPNYFHNRVRCSTVLAPPIEYCRLIDFFDDLNLHCIVSALDSYGLPSNFRSQPVRKGLDLVTRDFERICNLHKRDPQLRVWSKFSFCLIAPAIVQLQKRFERTDFNHLFLGQCIPGVRKIYVTPSGTMYPCEKVEGHESVRIGHVDSGIDPDLVEGLLYRFQDVISARCEGCWMRNICNVCLADLVHGGRFNNGKLELRCAGKRAAQEDIIALYAGMIHDYPGCMDFVQEGMIWE